MAPTYTDQDLLWLACQEGQIDILIQHMQRKDLPLKMLDYYYIIKKFIEIYPNAVKKKSPYYHHQASLAKKLVAALGESYQLKLQKELKPQLEQIEHDFQQQKSKRKQPIILTKSQKLKRTSYLKQLTDRLDKKIDQGDENLFDDMDNFD